MRVFQTFNPYTQEPIETYSYWSEREIDFALEKSLNGALNWQNLSLRERLLALQKVKKSIARQSEIFAQTISLEMGKNIKESRAEVNKCLSLFDFLDSESEKLLQVQELKSDQSQYEISFEPLGIILLIMPWNFPIWQVLRVALPALVAGNSILLKPANMTQGCGHLLAGVFEEELTTGVFVNLIVDHDQCAQILQDSRVAAVSMTASTAAGKKIAGVAGAAMKKMVFELGGSDPYLICEDANLELAAKACAQSRLQVSGQSCIAAKRIFLRREVQMNFLDLYHKHLEQAKFGNPFDPQLNYGPLTHETFAVLAQGQIRQLKSLGGKLLFESSCKEILSVKRNGDFYRAPHVPPQTYLLSSMIGLESLEIFAPVTTLFVCDSDEQMLQLANSSNYGLGAGVFSGSIGHAKKLAGRIQAGVVAINDYVRSSPQLPFGGLKDSGFGRELGAIGIKEFTNIKCIGSLT